MYRKKYLGSDIFLELRANGNWRLTVEDCEEVSRQLIELEPEEMTRLFEAYKQTKKEKKKKMKR
jgi:subtilisin-like proprotein convertase family protein